MKKQWIWLILFVVTIASILTVWHWQFPWMPPFLKASYYQNSAKVQPWQSAPPDSDRHEYSSVPVTAPTIDSKRVLTDLEALTFKRYEQPDRDRARDYISQSLQKAGWAPRRHPFTGGINIYAERRGTDPKAGVILLGAHYDTVERSPGADDNASSVATVLETARLLARQPTPRTLQVVFFDLEEEGLLGSKAFVEQIVPGEKLQGAIIMDMIGYACHSAGCQSYPPVLPIAPPTDQGDFLAVLGDQAHLPLVNYFSQAGQPDLPQILSLPVPTLGAFTPDLVRSDHAAFWKKGIGAVLVTDTANFRNPHYHQPSDTLEMIDQDFFLGSAQIVVNATTALLQNQDDLAAMSTPSTVESQPDLDEEEALSTLSS